MPSNRVLLLIVLLLAAGVLVANPPQQNLYPAYSASYSASDDLLRQILEEIKGLRSDLRQGVGQGQLTLQSVVTRKCASCHNVNVATQKGGDFVLVEADGKLADTSLGEKRTIKRRVNAVDGTRMPPPITGLSLSAEERALFELVQPQRKTP